MRRVLLSEFKSRAEFNRFLENVFASGVMAVPYDSEEYVALLVSAMKEGHLRIIEYDFCLNFKTLTNKNEPYDLLALHFRGKGNNIDTIRRTVYSLLPDGCGVTVEDGSDYRVCKPDMLICMGNKKLEYLYRRMETYGANTAYLMFPYLYQPDDPVESTLGTHQFYRIMITEKFLELLAAAQEQHLEAMRTAILSSKTTERGVDDERP